MSPGSKPLVHASLSHQILLVKYKFKGKINKNFKMATKEYEIPTSSEYGAL